ncbi:hypothetical protein KAFR_0G03550 [Kazachstania africana CBS 2517]|uniref:5'-deoxynucleotidase n=1 Tax=Kazachstania africana (strain ATCC 22294 / BCRC 22015 / CBS 2517 / CECT 1963 / NBRC 1671 / NRRL Y-8276) TaxID=1071382 RepID=H2AYD7_KAZAF|nr:hypothetical protein KAFR_0G03550 [Kazachstania africana CBS 2517]CCF59387.1 hypothetical protein KAFR_0G03550 [Kazachstania africana CBS 2517]
MSSVKTSISTSNNTISATAKLWEPKDHIPNSVKEFLDLTQPNYLLGLLNVIQQLKIQKRTGWLDYGMSVAESESISDHMYRMSIISMLISNPNVNRDKCMRIALVHDMAEAIVGDITPVDAIGKEEKHRREWETMKYVCNELIKPVSEIAAREIMEAWLDYERIESLEARYVKDIDKYELLVQCFEYEKKHNGKLNFQDFFSTVENIKTDEVIKWTKELISLREKFFASLYK